MSVMKSKKEKETLVKKGGEGAGVYSDKVMKIQLYFNSEKI